MTTAPRMGKRLVWQTCLRSLATLALALAALPAFATITLNGIVPANPIAGQTVAASLTDGGCDAIIVSPGYPQITRTGNTVRLLVDTVHNDDIILCNAPGGTGNFPFGAFPAGTYTLQVDRHYIPFVGPDVIETVGTLSFSVAEVAPVPASTGTSLMLLGLLIAALAAWALRSRSTAGLTLALVSLALPWSGGATAASEQYIEVLVSSNAGAPTAEQVVNYFSFSPPVGSPPLAAFNTVMPDGAVYLLPRRASGDFLAWLDANPDSVRAKLERYLLVGYSASTDIQAALSSLQSDSEVISANLPLSVEFAVGRAGGDVLGVRPFTPSSATDTYTQYGWDDLNIAAAWQLAGGYALIGDADSGLAVDHQALRQFSATGQYVGGNYVPASSFDVGEWPSGYDGNPDEAEPVPLPLDSPCNPNHLPAVEPAYAGHGTHVAGLIAANSSNGLGLKGICKHCGIAMWKIAKHVCNATSGLLLPQLSSSAFPAAVTLMTDNGIQVVNMSLGGTAPTNFCAQNPNDAWCLALAHANYRDALEVGSSGNARTRLNFPSSDTRVTGVGGFDSSIALWDESPGSTTLCPIPSSNSECGSNYTTVLGEPKQETMGSAKSVLSTTYPGKDWNTTLKCGDSFGPGGGAGLCTGTSMSAPQVAGVAGILRSINPLVTVSKPVLSFGDVAGVRTVLAETTVEAQSFQPWSQTFGYGRSDAAAAAARVLGKVEGRTAKNRATPLFRFYGSAAKDYLETTTPQFAIAIALNQSANYTPQGALVPGYSAFPQEPNTTALPAPRANVYVLTTEYKPRPEWPGLVPLYMVERSRPFPVGCTPGNAGCNGENRDFTLVTTTAEIEQAHTDGYSLRAIQGYIYQLCSNEPNCIPPGAQKFYRECKPADDDCATFLESERAGFEAAGYTVAYPTGSSKVMGYAYPATDSDGDGLVDGFEYVIGTRVDVADSDGDAASDAAEFPMAGLAVSDPCSGAGGGNCPADIIFQNGFQ